MLGHQNALPSASPCHQVRQGELDIKTGLICESQDNYRQLWECILVTHFWYWDYWERICTEYLFSVNLLSKLNTVFQYRYYRA